MLVTVTNLTGNLLSCDAGLLQPYASVTVLWSSGQMFKASAAMKALETKGYITLTVTEGVGTEPLLDPTTVGAAAAATPAAGTVVTSSLAAGAVTFAKAKTFVSTTQTGTGSSQNIAHGLGVVPAAVMWSVLNSNSADDVFAEGSHDSTNVKLTVTTGATFKVLAWA